METENPNVREGFRVLKATFIVPQDLNRLDSQAETQNGDL